MVRKTQIAAICGEQNMLNLWFISKCKSTNPTTQ